MTKKVLFSILLALYSCFAFSQQQSFIRSEVHFYVGTDSIICDSDYTCYANYVLPYIQANINNLDYVIITGYTSPDGPMSLNKDLAIKRTNKVASLINIDVKDKLKQYSKPCDLKYFSDKRDKKYYQLMRSAVIEMSFSFPDTVYVEKHDTIKQLLPKDTLYISDCRECIHKPLVTLKTNVLLDVIPYSPFGVSFTPNLSIELYTYLWKTSVEFEYVFPWWKNDNKHKYFQIINGTIGIRKYFKDYNGLFLGIYGNSGYYDLCINENKGWQGEHHGVGVSFGYVWLKHGWRIEPYARMGWINSRYDKYHAGNPFNGKYYYTDYNEHKRFYNSNYFGLTMIGINIGYDIINIWKK